MIKKYVNTILDSILKLLIKRPLVSLLMDARFQFHFQMLHKSISESTDFAIKNFPDAMYFYSDEALWSYVINKFKNGTLAESSKATMMEFGVWKGRSINYFASSLPNLSIIGFDSFEGFAQNWSGTSITKGDLNLYNKLPKVPSNVKLIKGYFEDTLPSFVHQMDGSQVSILHLDADIYEPTKFVLDTLSRNIKKGTIIIIDQFFGYVNFRNHEFRAWQEFASFNELNYTYIAFASKQVAIEIL